jgi:dipeptidyl aminopeptidase/acylaminoacyl peptidase
MGRYRCGLLIPGFLAVGSVVAGSDLAFGTTRRPLTLERLYAYPKLEGTAPERPKWSPDSRQVAFLWNDGDFAFHDLWLFDAISRVRRRLTRLETATDDCRALPAAVDRHAQASVPPDTGLADFQWSPDSTRLTFEWRGELYVVALAGDAPPTRLTCTGERETSPRFSPDSRALAFVSGGELYVRELGRGLVHRLTSGGGLEPTDDDPARPGGPPGTFKWSPDGRWLAFQHERGDDIPGRLIVDFAGDRVTARKQDFRVASEENARVRLGLVPAGSGATVWLTPLTDDYYIDWEWSPDSRRIALLHVGEDQKTRRVDVIDVEVAIHGGDPARDELPADGDDRWSRRIRNVLKETTDRWVCSICDFVTWSPDGRQLAFSSEISGWNHLYVTAADGTTSAPRQVTDGEWEVTDYRLPYRTTGDLQPAFSRDGRSLYFTANRSDPGERHLHRVSLADGRIEQLTDRKGVSVGVMSPDERRIAILFSSRAEPWDLFVKDALTGRTETVTQSPLPEFAAYEWPQPSVVSFPSRDGKRIRALVFAPSGLPAAELAQLHRTRPAAVGVRPAARRYPLIDFIHGAGYAQAVLDRWGGYMPQAYQLSQFAAQQGYVVVDVDYRGSAGYGRDWRTDIYLHLGGKDLDDQLDAMEYLRAVGWVDADRAGAWGISYGGFLTLMLMFKAPGTVRAGSAWAAVADWENYTRTYTQPRLGIPAERPEAYRRSSPIHHVAGLVGALQLQHGIMDANVHFQDVAQLTDGLVRSGKPFTQQFYPREGHVPVRPEVWTHAARSMFDFFARHLARPVRPPASEAPDRSKP